MTLLDWVDKQNWVSDRMPMPVDVAADTAYVQSITGETVQLYYFNLGVLTTDAGQAAGTVVVGKLWYTGILDELGAMIGNNDATSLAWTTGTVLPIAKMKPCPKEAIESPSNRTLEQIALDITKNFANGERCLDHRSGMIFGKKATTGTSDTAAYKVQTIVTGGGTAITENVNVAKVGWTATATNSGNKDAGTQRIVIATDDVNMSAIKTAVTNIANWVSVSFDNEKNWLRIQPYFDSDATYNIEYYCYASPSAKLNDEVRQISRLRKVIATGKLHDITYAISWWVWTSAFVFKATDLAYVSSLSYNSL